MITDEEIEKIFEWADKHSIGSKSKEMYEEEIENNSYPRRGLPRDKELLREITKLNLSRYDYDYIPEELCKLRNLKWLDLSIIHNLKKLPKNFLNLLNLEYLDLEYDKNIENLEIIFELNNLKNLDLSDMSLKDLSENISKLEKLEYLNLSSNELKKLPESFGKLKNLKELNLSYNNLKDIKILNNLNNLETLNIHGDEHNENILKYINLKNLKYLEIYKYTFIPKDIIEKCPNISIIAIDSGKYNELNNIKGMEFYKIFWSDAVLVRTPNIEKETLPQIEKPQKPFKNLLYKGE